MKIKRVLTLITLTTLFTHPIMAAQASSQIQIPTITVEGVFECDSNGMLTVNPNVLRHALEIYTVGTIASEKSKVAAAKELQNVLLIPETILQCTICFEGHAVQNIVVLPCGHVFCLQCRQKQKDGFRNKTECALCRVDARIVGISLEKLFPLQKQPRDLAAITYTQRVRTPRVGFSVPLPQNQPTPTHYRAQSSTPPTSPLPF